ncbi:hypothetical protein [Colwellia sp. TT2012]|uniref:hypothetical protein n=1 Tax=Colwellia sp. TT2012 TaxID=1720342 RepID=UPI00070F384F|nr:hypothetical protein [Colwellia sp. TT2012]
MKSWLLIIILLSLTSTSVYAEDEIKPFTSDGCSSFPDGTLKDKELWLSCCTAHDFSYWMGGTYQARVEADELLRQCVSNVGEPFIAELMLVGVRVGGTPYLPTKFRWGYGWPYPRGYKAINEKENKKIQIQLKLVSN